MREIPSARFLPTVRTPQMDPRPAEHEHVGVPPQRTDERGTLILHARDRPSTTTPTPMNNHASFFIAVAERWT
jgi:hypothetical protein